jgi:alpha-glucosidase (family GH31 glycosyl hydrolase)
MKKIAVLVLFVVSAHYSLLSQITPGNFDHLRISDKAVTVFSDSSAVRLVFYKTNIVRVDFLPTLSTTFDSSFVVIRDTIQQVPTTVTETDSNVVVASSELQIHIHKTPIRLAFLDGSGNLLIEESSPNGFRAVNEARYESFLMQSDEHFYGTGERGTSLDKRGQRFLDWNTQSYGYGEALPRMNINIPFILSSRGYGMYFENTYPDSLDIGASNPALFTFRASSGELSFYLFAGGSIQNNLDLYTWLTGKQPLPPKWALGYLQSKYGYRNESEARETVDSLRSRKFPCDGIILDLYWYSRMGDFSWNTGAFPDHGGMVSDFLTRGIKTILITEPYMVYNSANFAEAEAFGLLGKNSGGTPYRIANWWSCGCDAGLLDFSVSDAGQWFWNKHLGALGSNVAGLWSDLGEPENHPDDMKHALGSVAKIHNIYNLLWAQGIYEGWNQSRPNERIFNLTRSGYAGIQRYGVFTWSGDVNKSFRALSVQLPMLLGMGLSGLAYHGSDIGGFTGSATTPELYVRWMQFGTFSPITRAHGYDGASPTEPWEFGQQAEDICRTYIRTRYKLMPYIYSMAYQNHLKGMPLARPLFFLDPTDSHLTNESSTYLWGDAFAVSPVVQAGQSTKTLYLPYSGAGNAGWIDYWTDAGYNGGRQITVSTPIETMPVFVREGSIIPVAPDMNYVDELTQDTLHLLLYPKTAGNDVSEHFDLYEDDGKTLSYQSGDYLLTPINLKSGYTSDTTAIPYVLCTIDPAQGLYDGIAAIRPFVGEFHRIRQEPSSVLFNDTTLEQYFSYQDLLQHGKGYCYNGTSHVLWVFVKISRNVQNIVHAVGAGVDELTGVMSGELISQFQLEQNYPNPFNPNTIIRYSIPIHCHVTITIYNLLGEDVGTIVDQDQVPGSHSVVWEPKGLASGVYYCRLTAGTFSETKKLVLVR